MWGGGQNQIKKRQHKQSGGNQRQGGRYAATHEVGSKWKSKEAGKWLTTIGEGTTPKGRQWGMAAVGVVAEPGRRDRRIRSWIAALGDGRGGRLSWGVGPGRRFDHTNKSVENNSIRS